MADDGWDLISSDSESDLYWPEGENEDTVGDKLGSATGAKKKRNKFENESCGSGSDYGALLTSESDEETESEEGDEASEGENPAEELGQVKEDHETAFMSTHENDSEDASKENVEEGDEEINDESQDTDTLVDSTPGLQLRDDTSSPTLTASHLNSQKSAIEKLDDELENSIHRCENIIKPLIDEIVRTALNENAFNYLPRFARQCAIQESIPLAVQTKMSQLSSIIQELPGFEFASPQKYQPTAPRVESREEEFRNPKPKGKVVEDDGAEMKLRQYRSSDLARERLGQSVKGAYPRCVYGEYYGVEESDHSKPVTLSQALRNRAAKTASRSVYSQGILQRDPSHRKPPRYTYLNGQDNAPDPEIKRRKSQETYRPNHVYPPVFSGAHFDRWWEVKDLLAREYISPSYEIRNHQILW